MGAKFGDHFAIGPPALQVARHARPPELVPLNTSNSIKLPARFELDREIGRGGMAVVYRAHDRQLSRYVAIKVLSADLSNSVGVERFEREIALMAKLVHPGIVALFDSGESDGRLYYVMPLVIGETLRARLSRERRITFQDTAALGADIAEALAYAHGAGIVHRDVKPENVFTVGGRAMLADFGIARMVGERSMGGSTAGALTTSGTLLGTLSYMSPEQLGGEIRIDGRSDLYSLGCLLYELVTGTPPFVAPTTVALIGKHMIEAPVPPSVRGASITRELEEVILQLLAKDPDERPATAGDVARTLRAASHHASPTAAIALESVAKNESRQEAHLVTIGAIEHPTQDDECAQIALSAQQAITSSLCALPNLRVRTDAKNERTGGAQSSETNVVRISGAARRSGDRVRISLRVTEPDGVVSWSQNVDGTMTDAFALEDAVSETVARQFADRVTRGASHAAMSTPSIAVRTVSSPPPVSEADQLVLDGLRAFNKLGPTGGAAAKSHMQESFAYFRRALALDPNNARGLCALGNWYSVAAVSGIEPQEEGLQRGRELIFSALAADGQCAEVHCSLTKLSLYHDDDFHAAARHVRRAMELDPHEPEVLRLVSIVNKILGRVHESVNAAREATELAADNAPLWNTYADSLLAAGRNAEAVDALKRAISLLPGYGPALERMELAHSRLGAHQRALEIRISRLRLAGQAARAELLEKESESVPPAEVIRNDVRRELNVLLLDAEKTDPFLHHVRRTVADRIVAAHAELGEWDEAMVWVEKAYDRRPGRLRRMLADLPVDYHGLAVNPRYARLMRVAGMEEFM